MKRLLMIVAALLVFGSVAYAQQSKSDEKLEFKPHWSFKLQGGASYTTGEADFGKLLSPAAQLSGTYNFHHAMGVRAALGGWQGRGAVVVADEVYKFNFVQLSADYVVDVANFLNSMGAKIRGAGTDIIKITGVPHLHGVQTYSVIPDQIEAGTYMIAAAATGGNVTVKNIIPRHQESLTAKLLEMNVGVEEGEDWIRIYNNGVIQAANVKTLPYPGFPTDMQPQITVLLSLADGTSKIVESVTDFRFQYTEELKRMGADITVNGKMAMVSGPKKLKGMTVQAPDLRGGAALIIGALAAEGETMIQDVQFIDRGYDDIVGKLQSVGAKIVRVEDDD